MAAAKLACVRGLTMTSSKSSDTNPRGSKLSIGCVAIPITTCHEEGRVERREERGERGEERDRVMYTMVIN